MCPRTALNGSYLWDSITGEHLLRVMNVKAEVNYLKLHMEGVRFDKGGKKLHKHYPAKPIWREQEVRKKLHLTPEYKEKICVRAAKLFSGGLTNVGDWPK